MSNRNFQMFVFVALFCVCFAQAQTNLTVKLWANPTSESSSGVPVQLMTKVDYVKPTVSIVTPNLTYSYQARRTWPCQETIVIAQNAGPSITWLPSKGGEFELTVIATVRPVSTDHAERITSKPIPYHVMTPDQAGTFVWSFSPPDGATPPPSSVSVTLSVLPPLPGYSYRYKLGCTNFLGPVTCSSSTFAVVKSSSNSNTWSNIGLAPGSAGTVSFQGFVDVGKPNCSVASGMGQAFYSIIVH
jgi:hypothetical protein